MKISDKVKRLLIVLQRDVLADGAEVIAPVRTPRGLNSG
jgi:hypothetical protein